ncbi:MAG: hypothetical protein KA765_07840 [Thermoflexales bacterium]|nr:hypothetical protein [Thermoflexales bacterium]
MSTYLTALKLKIQTALVLRTPLAEVPDAELGNGLVEMALILALVVIVAVGVLSQLGVDIVGKLVEVANALH